MTEVSMQESIYTVPQLLYGPSRRQSHSRWRTIAKRAAQTGSWEEALKGIEFIAIEDVNGDFAVNTAHAMQFTGDNLWLDNMFESLFHACWERFGGKDRDASQVLLSSLTESGLEHFWFALSVCVAGVWLGLWRTPEEKLGCAKSMLPKLLRWWPMICVYDQRFSLGQNMGNNCRGWPLWSTGLGQICGDLGIDYRVIRRLTEVGPIEAAKIATVWLENTR